MQSLVPEVVENVSMLYILINKHLKSPTPTLFFVSQGNTKCNCKDHYQDNEDCHQSLHFGLGAAVFIIGNYLSLHSTLEDLLSSLSSGISLLLLLVYQVGLGNHWVNF